MADTVGNLAEHDDTRAFTYGKDVHRMVSLASKAMSGDGALRDARGTGGAGLPTEDRYNVDKVLPNINLILPVVDNARKADKQSDLDDNLRGFKPGGDLSCLLVLVCVIVH